MAEKQLDDLADRIDAAVFSSDSLFNTEFLKTLKYYSERWLRAIEQHQEGESK